MRIDKEIRKEWRYLEEYDRLGDCPDKKVQICITIPLSIYMEISKEKNRSEFIEKAIIKELKKSGALSDRYSKN